jgi:hypothetical protein
VVDDVHEYTQLKPIPEVHWREPVVEAQHQYPPINRHPRKIHHPKHPRPGLRLDDGLTLGILKEDPTVPAPAIPASVDIPASIDPHVHWKEPVVDQMYRYPPLIPYVAHEDKTPKELPNSITISASLTIDNKRDTILGQEVIANPVEIPRVEMDITHHEHNPLQVSLPQSNGRPLFPVHNLRIQARAETIPSTPGSGSGIVTPPVGTITGDHTPIFLAIPFAVMTFLYNIWSAFENWENPAHSGRPRHAAKDGGRRIHARSWNVSNDMTTRGTFEI